MTGTADTPPKFLQLGKDTRASWCGDCVHGVPHAKCWPGKDWECDRTKLTSWYWKTRHMERTGQDLVHEDRYCKEITKE